MTAATPSTPSGSGRSRWRRRVVEALFIVAAIAGVVQALPQFGVHFGNSEQGLTPAQLKAYVAVLQVTPTVQKTAITTRAQANATTGHAKKSRSMPVAKRAVLTLDGRMFKLRYPPQWHVVRREAWQSGIYVDTILVNGGNPKVLVRVDVTPHVRARDPMKSAAPLRDAVARSSLDYRTIGFRRTSFGGHDAVSWEFTDVEQGTAFRKRDVFFTDAGGNGFAVLTQAPVTDYPRFANDFDSIRASVKPAAD